ncbi:MAG: hypothetical protein Q7V20_05230 [Aquabacterium sp.]|uniref:hypothetical protein n=1 Tax=Aquabacterium sp. TaxID=1872578 RepID=UPI00271E6DD0|nr:hypothetical protein [Aquabacterium sp.]MDO9002837.1 hypothetical protein [Aquabacterium sp.]
MSPFDTSIAVGIARVDGGVDKVILVTSHTSTTLTTNLAKMVATQLIMAADLIENLDQAPDHEVSS